MSLINEVFTMNISQLNELTEAIKTRRKHLGEIKATGLEVGDEVTFMGRSSGKWEGMQTGTIVKKNRKNAKVSVQSPVSGLAVTWSVPYNMLTPKKVELNF